MKRKRALLIFLSLLLILPLRITYSEPIDEPLDIAISSYVDHEPIVIINDQNFTDYGFPGSGIEEDPFLIVCSRGTQISRDVLEYHKKKLDAIDPDFLFYHMRYTAAWRAYKQTKNIYATQQLLRHSRPDETVTYLGIQLEEMLETQRQDMLKIFKEVQL